MKKCYYDVLEITPKSTLTEVKQNYRRLAMIYHPDKNSSEQAKAMFLQVTQAYTVLSDPNERTWYDNNREKIMMGKDDMSKEDQELFSFGFNIWDYFQASCYSGFGDGAEGFFGVYRSIFEKIKAEQFKAYQMRETANMNDQSTSSTAIQLGEFRRLEGFGDSGTGQDKMLKFYSDWENFTTYKTFAWSDEYDTRDAGNRWMRREMEKENKKERQKEKKNYIKTIKDLAAFARRRDPRYKAYLRELELEEERKEEQKILDEQQKKKDKQEHIKRKQEMDEVRFKELEDYYRAQGLLPKEGEETNLPEEDQEVPEFYCPLCDKAFKSENQLINHEKSKMHKTNLKAIKKEVMTKEDIMNEVQEATQNAQAKQKGSNKKPDVRTIPEAQIIQEKQPQPKQQPPPSVEEEVTDQPTTKKKKNKNKGKKKAAEEQKSQGEEEKEEEIVPQKVQNVQPKGKKAQKQQQTIPEPVKQVRKSPQPPPKSEESSDQDDEQFIRGFLGLQKGAAGSKKGASREDDEQTQPKAKNKQSAKQAEKKVEDSESSGQDSGQGGKKLGAAKLKRQKKAEQQAKNQGQQFVCKTCKQVFASKSKLFTHIEKTGHAATKK